MTQLSKLTTCRGCGKEIAFIKTKAGKSMPVNPEAKYYVPDERGNAYVTIEGAVEKGREPERNDPETRIGYISHFATCPARDAFRKKTKSERKGGK